jgi:hypothetical protein
MPYFSKFYGIEVRDEIAKEWTDENGKVDDMMAGLHEVRARQAESAFDLKTIEQKLKAGTLTSEDLKERRVK